MRVRKVTMYQVYSEKVGDVLKDFIQTESPQVADKHYKELIATKGFAVRRERVVEKRLMDIFPPYSEDEGDFK